MSALGGNDTEGQIFSARIRSLRFFVPLARSAQYARFVLADLQRYVDFHAGDSERLAHLHAHAVAELPAIAETFCQRLLESEGARAILGDEARRAPTLERLKTALAKWMGDILAGPHDDAFLERARRIGWMHVRVGAAPRYVLGAMSTIRTALTSIASRVMADQLLEVQASLSKVLDLQAGLMMDAYAEERLERARREERERCSRAAEELAGVEWALESSTERANVALIGLDAEGRIVLFNSKASHLTGYGADEVLEKDAFQLLFGDAARAAREHVLASERLASALELTVRTKTGAYSACRFYVSRHAPWGQRLPTHLLTAVDHNEEGRELRRMRRKERLAAITHLGSGFAHEIRNPLNGAMLHVALMARATRAGAATSELTTMLGTVHAELGRIARLTDDFLAFASPLDVRLQTVSVHELCAQVAEGARALAHEDIALETDLPAEPLSMEADAKRLTEALDHLMRNAVEALGEGAGRVVLRARREPAHVALEVEDDGPGLGTAEDPIFDPFFTTKPDGTGLGLAIVQRTAMDHGGAAEVDSREGRTVFRMHLPLTGMRGEP